MKFTYKLQMIISVVIILLANIISTILKHWLYRSIGFVICGLLWIIHPVVPAGMEANRKARFWTRVAGIILILIGVFTRAYFY